MKRIVCVLLIAVLALSLASCMEPSPKEFTSNGMSITLTDRFVENTYEGYTVCYDSSDAAVFALKEAFTLQAGLGELSLDEYAQLVYQANSSKSPETVAKEDGLTIMEYSFLNEAENQTYRYLATMFKAEDAFWLVQFACVEDDYEAKRPLFMEWAKSVTFAS